MKIIFKYKTQGEVVHASMYHSFYLEQKGNLNIRKKTMVYVKMAIIHSEKNKRNCLNKRVIVPYVTFRKVQSMAE